MLTWKKYTLYHSSNITQSSQVQRTVHKSLDSNQNLHETVYAAVLNVILKPNFNYSCGYNQERHSIKDS